MQLLDRLKKPEYYLQPSRLFKRLFKSKKAVYLENTPWHEAIEVDPNEVIGKSVSYFGVYDLAVSEMLWRLINPGDFVLDIGANIGYTTNLSSNKTGKDGRVWSFEPNPDVLTRLSKNISVLKNANVTLFPIALSDKTGEGFLEFPTGYGENEGIAYIGDGKSQNSIKVPIKKLDDIISADDIIQVLKIDVEGHELAVFNGAERLLDNKMIKNIVFEDAFKYPSPVANLLISKGFSIFRIEKGWLNLVTKDPNSAFASSSYEPTNYIATLDETMLQKKLKGAIYKCILL